MFLFFFFKQKTAYEMRISDWSSDVCSSDLHQPPEIALVGAVAFLRGGGLRARGRLLGRQLDLLGDRVDASLDTAGLIIGLELRCPHVQDAPARTPRGPERVDRIHAIEVHQPTHGCATDDNPSLPPLP